MTQSGRPWRLKEMTPGAVRDRLQERPSLVVPVGTTEQHGPHLPARLRHDHRRASRRRSVGAVRRSCARRRWSTASTRRPTRFPGGASLRRRTLHRVMNELIESWEEGAGVRGIHHPDRAGERGPPRGAEHHPDRQRHGPGHRRLQPRFRAAARPPRRADPGRRARHVAAALPRPGPGPHGSWPRISPSRHNDAGRYRPGHSRRLPQGSPGSVGFPSLASAQKGELLYRFILDRISSCLTGP